MPREAGHGLGIHGVCSHDTGGRLLLKGVTSERLKVDQTHSNLGG